MVKNQKATLRLKTVNNSSSSTLVVVAQVILEVVKVVVVIYSPIITICSCTW